MCAHNVSMPSPLSAEQVTTGGDQFGERGGENMQRRAVFGRGELGAGKIVAVGLVDRDHVGELDDAFLERLQFVAGARQRQHEKEISHVGNRDFRLADADGLDQHDVVARGLAQQHGLARLRRNAAERARRRRGTDESLFIIGKLRHARLVGQDRPAGAARRRIDRQHRDFVALTRSACCRALRSWSICRRPARR